jgi:hypothetical protein
MGFLEPEGRAECDECGEEVEVNLVQLATVIHSSWMYEPEELPAGWFEHRGDIWCPEHAEKAARDLGLLADETQEES